MNHIAILLVAALVLAFGTISRRIQGTILTPPMIFVAAGLLLGPEVFGLVDAEKSGHLLHLLAEVALILVLFSDAARIELRALRRELGLPVRLLGVGMPLCILLGTAVAKGLLPELTWLEASVLAAVLAPTDAALGQAVVSDAVVPLRIRQALNVESGLNDGIALPVVTILSALASMASAETRTAAEWATFAAVQVTLGPLAGVGVGLAGAKLVLASVERNWMSDSFVRLSGLSLALLAYASAHAVGGNGFIGAFVAGMTFGHIARHRLEVVHAFLEAEGKLLVLVVFLLLGASVLGASLAEATPRMVGYALLSLTVVRMVSAAVSLSGSRVHAMTIGFLGWFGPRGLASVLFALLIVGEADLAHGHLIFSVTMLTVVISVMAHGITAAPLATLYGRLASDDEHPAENEAVHPHRPRTETYSR